MKEILFEILRYIIGLILVGIMLWIIIAIHNYFSKDNIPLEELIKPSKPTS
jgi:hypothetical protein